MEYLKLFENCKPVKGYTRSVLYDMGKQQYHFIPNLLWDMIHRFDRKQKSEIVRYYQDEDPSIIEDYLQFIVSNHFGFWGSPEEVDRFIPLSMEWDSPSVITNAILCFEGIKNKMETLFQELEDLLCHHLMIVYERESNVDPASLSSLLKKSSIQSITLMLPYTHPLQEEKIIQIMQDQVRIKTVCLHSADSDKVFYSNPPLSQNAVKIKRETFCSIQADNFIVNLPFFTESQTYNTCLNRKLCIDAEGNIKNCLFMQPHFGTIYDTSLQQAVENPDFKKIGCIGKDRIEVCKDCEFRHMCMDCRCMIKDKDNILSQPAACTYNPYICKWEGEEGYVPVEACGKYNKETGFIPHHDKIAEINSHLWKEDA